MNTERDRIDFFISAFSAIDGARLDLLYDCMLHCLRSNSGIGFKGHWQGDPLYIASAKGDDTTDLDYDDGSDRNSLYHMMKAASELLWDRAPIVQTRTKGYYVNSWEDFCRIAVEGFNATGGQRPIKQIWE